MQQKRLFPGEGIKVFRERIFDPLLHGLEYAHMGTIIANSGENGKGISVAFQTAPDIEGGFDQTVRVMTKKNGKTMSPTTSKTPVATARGSAMAQVTSIHTPIASIGSRNSICPPVYKAELFINRLSKAAKKTPASRSVAAASCNLRRWSKVKKTR